MAQVAREIYTIGYIIVDASGGYSIPTGYPMKVDSHQNNDDLDKTHDKAYKEFHAAISGAYNATTRPIQIINMIRVSDGVEIESKKIIRGPLVWNTPEPEPEPEPEGE